jgi:hypothetical protein
MKKKIKELLFGKSIPLTENKIQGKTTLPECPIEFYKWCQLFKVSSNYPKQKL